MLSQDVLNTRFLNTDVTLYFLNTNYANDTNIFWHTDLTDLTDLCSRRGAHSFLNTNNSNKTNIFIWHTDLTLLLSFYLLQESLGDVAGGDGT